MTARRDWLVQELSNSGFVQVSPGVFSVMGNRRVIALIATSYDPSVWEAAVVEALRNEAMTAAASWSRYVVLVVSSSRTAALAAAAAAFSHDVSKCRRLVVFEDSDSLHDAIPFLPLPFVHGGSGSPRRDLDEVVRSVLDGELAEKFLDPLVTVTQLQRIAEEYGDD